MRLQLLMMLVPMMMTETTIRFRMLILTTDTIIAHYVQLPLCDNHQSTDSSKLLKLKTYVPSALAKCTLSYT